MPLSSWGNVFRELLSRHSKSKMHSCLAEKRRNRTEEQRGARPLSCIQVSWDVSRIHRTSFRVRQAVEGGEGTPTGTHPRQGRVDGARASPEPQPHGRFQPPPPRMCSCVFMDVSGRAVAPQKKKMTPNKRGSKCCCLMSCRLLSFSLGG